MEFKGTKGEWYYQKESDAYTNIIRSNKGADMETTWVTSTGQSTNLEHKANAYLIAAAPNLLNACIEALKHHQGGHSKIGALLKEAIDKALIIEEDEKPF